MTESRKLWMHSKSRNICGQPANVRILCVQHMPCNTCVQRDLGFQAQCLPHLATCLVYIGDVSNQLRQASLQHLKRAAGAASYQPNWQLTARPECQCWAPAQPQERQTRPNREYSQLHTLPVLHSDQPSLQPHTGMKPWSTWHVEGLEPSGVAAWLGVQQFLPGQCMWLH